MGQREKARHFTMAVLRKSFGRVTNKHLTGTCGMLVGVMASRQPKLPAGTEIQMVRASDANALANQLLPVCPLHPERGNTSYAAELSLSRTRPSLLVVTTF